MVFGVQLVQSGGQEWTFLGDEEVSFSCCNTPGRVTIGLENPDSSNQDGLPMCQTDAECVRLCLNGHPEAFGDLVHRYQAPLVRYLTGRVGNEEEAVEVAQETVVRAWCTLRKLKKPESFHCWLLGIAGRVAKETQRKRRRRGQIVSLPREPEVQPEDCPGAASNRPDTTLDQAVAGLPDIYREVVLLRYYGGLTCAEVGGELGLSLGTVTMRLSRAYGLLRECLAEEE